MEVNGNIWKTVNHTYIETDETVGPVVLRPTHMGTLMLNGLGSLWGLTF